jgi:hypothetical protein
VLLPVLDWSSGFVYCIIVLRSRVSTVSPHSLYN